MVADEEEVLRALRQFAEVFITNDIQEESAAWYLGREVSRYVQQRVSSAFGLDCSPLVVLDLSFQSPDEVKVDFLVHMLFAKSG